MHHVFLRLALLATLAVPLAAAAAGPTGVKTVETRAAIPAANGASAPLIVLKKTLVKATDEKVGTLRSGLFCGNPQDIRFVSQIGSLFTANAFRSFRHELDLAGYPKPQASDAIFDTGAPKAAPDYEVGLAIRDLQIDGCKSGANFDGGMWVQLHWELFAPRLQKVVYSVDTEGAAQTGPNERVTASDIATRAVTAAIRNLLADPGFAAQVKAPPSGPVPEAAKATGGDSAETGKLALAHRPAAGAKLVDEVPELRSAVVTITNGLGSGSGFYIDSRGYLLTNQHVVGDAQFVKVKLANGRELVGEVIRSDRARDVALVKTEGVALAPLAIAADEPPAGTDVYAVGSPLGEKFASSVTRGVISGTRVTNDQRWLQSDVRVMPGSSGGPLLGVDGAVVGIASRGVSSGLAGINLFVPIQDALTVLQIGLVTATATTGTGATVQ
jgi:S1-C subfamily serine protease